MKKQLLLSLFGILLIVAIYIASCRKSPKVIGEPPIDTVAAVTLTPDTIIFPARFPAPIIPDDNKPFKERIALGRMLYYDPILSNDGRACASCHHQAYGFTIPGTVMDMPVLPHVNLTWNTNFMWDGSKKGNLEELMLFEVKEFFGTDLNKVNQSEKYKLLFKKYFGVDNITYKELAYALAQFVRTQISKDSKYDRFKNGQVTLTTTELKGMQIFFTEKGDCFHCHVEPVTTDNIFHNTGLDSLYAKNMDKGYYNVTGNPEDMGKFRTPNLRNVALRNRFMHDGRFSTLEEVINFYDHGVYRVSNLDPIMTKPGKQNGLKLTEEEKFQLLAFLNTFTDTVFTNNKNLSKPD
jgi:cytochrome c peroxidase